MSQPSVWVYTLLRISALQQKAGEGVGAFATVDEALNIVERERQRDGVSILSIAGLYQAVARQLSANGQRAKAGEDQGVNGAFPIRRRDIPPCAKLQTRGARSGNLSTALAALDLIEGDENRAYALAQLAFAQAEQCDPTAAQTSELAYTAARNGGSKTDHGVFQVIAVTRGILGDFPGALAIVNELRDQSRTWPLSNLTGMLVAAGRKQEAIALADAQTDPQARAYALLGAASQLIRQAEAQQNKLRHG